MKKTVCIIFGGMSSEHEVSCLSASSLLENIDASKYNILKIGITKDGRQFLLEDELSGRDWESGKLTPAIISPCAAHHGIMVLDKANKKYEIVNVDCFFSLVHGETGEDGVLQGLLQLSGVPYVGCDTASSAVCMDKTLTKLFLEKYNIPQAAFEIVNKTDFDSRPEAVADKILSRFSLPVFVKPSSTGSSVGISKAKDKGQLIEALNLALSYGNKALCEEFVPGREIEVAVLKLFGENSVKDTVVSYPGEIKPNTDFYDYETKYFTSTAECLVPAELDQKLSEKIRAMAAEIFELLGCDGMSRVDFFLQGENIIFNEINTIPGFTKTSMYPKLIAHAGIPYTQLIDTMIEYAINK